MKIINFYKYLSNQLYIYLFIDENGFQEYDDTIVAGETGMQQSTFFCLQGFNSQLLIQFLCSLYIAFPFNSNLGNIESTDAILARMLKDYQLRQMYQLLTENSVEGKRSTSITGAPLGKNKRSVDKRKVCLFVFFRSYKFFLIQTISNKCCKKQFQQALEIFWIIT